ncbi:MAG: argininosuccinate lyase [Bacteroidota bacterium]|nr:argininosuccinate lyase [Bacteroidota bacterium]
MKTWDKGYSLNIKVENFTLGKDPEMDLILAPYDILGSIAHVKMLRSVGLLTKKEENDLLLELRSLYKLAKNNKVRIDKGVEDIHSQIEQNLTEKLGDIGKKVHTARSRNDQVLLDLKLFTRDQINVLSNEVLKLFKLLLDLSEANKNILMPGYTHLQVAMPSSAGLWFGAFAESLTDDMILLNAAYKIINQNPLGSAAGYGSAFPIRREITTKLLGFENMTYNSIYSQMGRTKTEKTVAFALSSISSTLSKLAMDITLFMSQNFSFIRFPDEFTTGSSIMPHKKNPDVFELVRAKCNKIQALPNEIALISGNLPTGYHRDYQILKESYMPAFTILKDCIQITTEILKTIEFDQHILDDKRYQYIFSVEEINKKVTEGVPFREAYNEVAESIAKDNFKPNKNVNHTHEGSSGNLCNNEIKQKMESLSQEINFLKAQHAIQALLE